jgi:hypothetical protein
VRRHLESRLRARVPADTASVDGQDQHLAAEAVGDLREELRARDGSRVHADLVCSRAQEPVHVVRAADTPADGQRDEHLLGRASDHVVRRLPVTGGRRDIEEREFVRTAGVVRAGELDRVARITEVLEVDSLDDAAGIDVEARDHTD